jgi:hypothetical protein
MPIGRNAFFPFVRVRQTCSFRTPAAKRRKCIKSFPCSGQWLEEIGPMKTHKRETGQLPSAPLVAERSPAAGSGGVQFAPDASATSAIDGIHASPRIVAQRKQLQDAFGSRIARQPHSAQPGQQQKHDGSSTMQARSVPINDSPSLEQEAAVMGQRALRAGAVAEVPAQPQPMPFGRTAQLAAGGVVQRRAFDYKTAGIEFTDAQEASNAAAGVAAAHVADSPRAYVATVPTTASGKDKGPVELANQYVNEAFADPAEAQQRFALTAAINRFQPTLADPISRADLLNGVADYAGTRLGAAAYTWKVMWQKTAGADAGASRTTDQVKADYETQPEAD